MVTSTTEESDSHCQVQRAEEGAYRDRPAASRILDAARCDAPISQASAIGADPELQRLLAQTRKNSTLQQEIAHDQNSPPNETRQQRDSSRTPQGGSLVATPGVPNHTARRATRTPPPSTRHVQQQLPTRTPPRADRKVSNRAPRSNTEGQDRPRQPPVPQAGVTQREASGSRTFTPLRRTGSPVQVAGRHTTSVRALSSSVLGRSNAGAEIDVATLGADTIVPLIDSHAPALAEPSMDTLGVDENEEQEEMVSEEDTSWEQELKRVFGRQLKEVNSKRTSIVKRKEAVEQAMRRIRLDQSKLERQVKTELAEAQSELENIEKKSDDRLKILRTSAEKSEVALDSAHADLQEVRRLAELAMERDAAELQELTAQKNAKAELAEKLSTEAEFAAARCAALVGDHREQEREAVAERAEAKRLRASILEAEAAISEKLRKKFRAEATVVHQKAVEGVGRCASLTDELDCQNSRAKALQDSVSAVTARVNHTEAELEGFQQAMQLSGEATVNQLELDLANLRREEHALLHRFESLTAAQQTDHVDTSPTSEQSDSGAMFGSGSGERLRETAEAVCAELQQHQTYISRLFSHTAATPLSASASMAKALQWSRSSGNEGNGRSCGSSARTPRELPSSVSPAVEVSPPASAPWPSSCGSNASPWLHGPLAGGRRVQGGADFLATPMRSSAREPASKQLAADMSASEAQLQRVAAVHEVERRHLEAMALTARGACDAALVSLRQAEVARWTEELQFWQMQQQLAIRTEAQEVHAGSRNRIAATLNMRANYECSVAEARISAAQAATAEALAAEANVARTSYSASGSREASLATLPNNESGPQTASLIACVAKLEAEYFEASLHEESLQRQLAEADEVCQLRKSETQALREVAAANAELRQWQDDLEASAQDLHLDGLKGDQRLLTLRAEVAEKEGALEELCRNQELASAQHQRWVTATEGAMLAEVEAAHVANIEALMALDSRLNEERGLQKELGQLVSDEESWLRAETEQAHQQAVVAEEATQRTDAGNELQTVYANRAKEVEMLYTRHADMLKEKGDVQVNLQALRSALYRSEQELVEAQRKESEEAIVVRSEQTEECSLQSEVDQASQVVQAYSASLPSELGLFQDSKRRRAEAARAYERVVEEHRNLLDEVLVAREKCALAWRGLDEDEAHHATLIRDIDAARQHQAAEASMEVAAAVAKAGQAIKIRISRCVAENAAAAEKCSRLGIELQEAENGCDRLSHALESGSQDFDLESDRVLREEDIDAAAHLGKMQAAASAAAEAAAQSAEAVGVAEEEVASLIQRLSQARADCAEKSRSLTLAAENVERCRSERRRTESELKVLLQEVEKLKLSRSTIGFESLDGGTMRRFGQAHSLEVDPWIARERRTETVPREQMLLLQYLRGSQRGGAGAGNVGSSALEALRDLREQQVLQASALSTEENLLCSELQRSVQVSLFESRKAEETLRLELKDANLDRELLGVGQDGIAHAEQHFEQTIARANAAQEAKDALDDGTVARMSIVMGDAQIFLDEQEQRICVVEQERDEARNRLLDILIHLEGPEYAEMVVSTAMQAAANERIAAPTCLEELNLVDKEPDGDASGLEAQWLVGRRSRSPTQWQPPPTIVEEDA